MPYIHKWPPCNFLFGYVFKEIHVSISPSTQKMSYWEVSVVLANGGQIMAHSNLRHLYEKSQIGLTNLGFMF